MTHHYQQKWTFTGSSWMPSRSWCPKHLSETFQTCTLAGPEARQYEGILSDRKSKKKKCSPRLPWLQGWDAIVVHLLCTLSAPGEELCLREILTLPVPRLSFWWNLSDLEEEEKKACWELAMSALQEIQDLLSRAMQYDFSAEVMSYILKEE